MRKLMLLANLLVVVALGLCSGCGSNDAKIITVTLIVPEADDPMSDGSGVEDILFAIQDKTEDTGTVFWYPGGCVQSEPPFAQGCGFSRDEEFNLKLCFRSCSDTEGVFIPPEHQASVIFCGRDSDGNIIFRGESDPFFNDPAQTFQMVDLNVIRGTFLSCLTG